MSVRYWSLLPIFVLLILLYFFWLGLGRNPKLIPSVMIGKNLPSFQLPNLEDLNQSFDTSSLQGQISLLNIWASWCRSCSEEQVFLLELARQSWPIYGLNYKDDPQSALQWLNEWGNPYKISGFDQDGKAAMNLGVYGTPETFLIDQAGIIRYRHIGPLSRFIWQTEFLPIIHLLQQEL